MHRIPVLLMALFLCLLAKPALAQDEEVEIELSEDEVTFCDSMNHLIDVAVLNFNAVKGETIREGSSWLSTLELPGTYDPQIVKQTSGSYAWQAEAITTSDEEQATFEYNRLTELIGNCSISMAVLAKQETAKEGVSSMTWLPSTLNSGFNEGYKNIRIRVEKVKTAEMTDDVGMLDMFRVFLYVENIVPKAY